MNRTPLVYAAIASLGLCVAPACLHPASAQDHSFVPTPNLEQHTVFAINQDSIGFMWFGTEDGVIKWDGYSLRKYRPRTVPHGDIVPDKAGAICEWHGRIWIGWSNQGLSWYNRSADSITTVTMDGRLPSVESLCADDSTLWIGTIYGLFCVKETHGVFSIEAAHDIEAKALGKRYIPGIARGKDGSLYFATYDGVLIWNKYTGSTRWLKSKPFSHQAITNDSIHSVLCDHSGNIWIGTHRGVDTYIPGSGSVVRTLHRGAYVNALCEYDSSRLWVGSYEEGYAPYTIRRNDSLALVQLGPPDQDISSTATQSVYSLFSDRCGTVWVGLRGGGVKKIAPEEIKFTSRVFNESDFHDDQGKAVWTFCDSRNQKFHTILVGTGKALLEFDIRHQAIVRRLQTHYAVRAIVPSAGPEEGEMWVGTLGEGLLRVASTQSGYRVKARYLYDSRRINESCIYALRRSRNGKLWVATNGVGLLEFDPATGAVARFPMQAAGAPVQWVLAMNESKNGDLWISGWKQGLIRFHAADGTYDTIRFQRDGARLWAGMSVYSICVPRNDNDILWLGSDGEGLIRYNTRDGTAEAFDERAGLSNNIIYGVVEDESGMLWCATNAGLTRFDPATRSATAFQTSDGLTNSSFNLGALFVGRGGCVFVGGDRGFDWFNPAGSINASEPKLVLTAARSSSRSISPADVDGAPTGLTLLHDERFLHFEFCALHYKESSKNMYSFTMEGFDTAWSVPSPVRFIEYQHLPPGNYVLKARAANADGIWTRQNLAIPIRIVPPVWMNWWFILGIGCLVGVLGFLVQAGRQRHAVFLEGVRSTEREQLRSKMAADIHDELGARAAKISIAASLLCDENGQSSPGVTPALHTLASDAQRLVQEMREMTWEVDPRKDTLMDLAIYLKSFSDELFDPISVAFRIEGLQPDFEAVHLSMEQRQQISRIFKEAITNSYRHARGVRHVELSISLVDRTLEMALSDDGDGFDAGRPSHGNGMRNMSERAARLGGCLSMTSRHGERTSIRFTCKLP
jgi:ligand-binding sensor domain-containing protein/signal transduction histidine kinase